MGRTSKAKAQKIVAPYWVYGATDEPEALYNFIGAFNERDDAEDFVNYRKNNVKNGETIFEIKDYSEVMG